VTLREQAALSAMGAELANLMSLGDVLELPYPRALIDEANYTLRARGLVILVNRERKYEACPIVVELGPRT
jgi:hypothetical protein